MTLFYIPNLSSNNVVPIAPWAMEVAPPPKGMTKKDYSTWISNPATNSVFVSAFSGLNPHARVSKTANPAYEMHGLIADYDTPTDEDELRETLDRKAKVGFRPAYAHRSVSGHARVIWLFEKPLLLVPNLTELFLKQLKKESNANGLFANLDDNILRPEQYYHWNPPALHYSDERISESALQYMMGKAFDAARNYKGEGDVEVPLDRVYEEVQERWPGRWTGRFEVGSRGPVFWDPDSKNPTSAIITATGVVTFSQPKPFYSWSDILGAHFVRQFQQDKFGQPLAAYYYDGRSYWHRNERNVWVPENKDNSKAHLVEQFNLSGAPAARGVLSDADKCLLKIRETRNIDKAFPILYSRKDTAFIDNQVVLNINRITPVQPVEHEVVWGEGFPWLAGFLNDFFEPVESPSIPGVPPLTVFLSWLHRFYKSALEGCLVQGHAIFIAGGVGRGKTLLSNVVVGTLMGRHSDASDFLLGDSAWNKELLESPVWCVDDAKAITSHDKRQVWSAMIKKSVANTKHPYNVKYHDPATVDWKGRIICSLNDDPESIQQIPHTDMSILDKIMLFHTSEHQPDFPPNDVLEATIRAELPYFARYVKDYEIPEELKGHNRFGVKSYHHPVLLEDTRAMSLGNSFAEVIEEFKIEHRRSNPEKLVWTGTSMQLLRALLATESLKEIVRQYSNNSAWLGRRLASLASTGDLIRRLPLQNGYARWEIDLAPYVDEPEIKEADEKS